MGNKPVSLLDQVLKAKDSPSADSLLSPDDDQPHTLPDGSVVYDSTIVAINRILALNPHLHKRPTGITSSPYVLYNGHTSVDILDKQTFLTLLKADWEPRTKFQTVFLVNKVMELVPVLSRDCIIISDSLVWDRTTATLHRISPEDTFRTVS